MRYDDSKVGVSGNFYFTELWFCDCVSVSWRYQAGGLLGCGGGVDYYGDDMRIPKRFKLFGHTITVEYEPMLDGRHGCNGEARYTTGTIALQPNTDTFNRPQSQQEHVFLHELVHHILNEMYEHELRANEKFVETFSALLHQALTTMEYEEGGQQ